MIERLGSSGVEAPASAVALADALRANLVNARRARGERLLLAAAWVDAHPPEAFEVLPGARVPGASRPVPAGGDGTPEVDEFAAAELGVLLETTTTSAGNLMADAVDLRHRHPLAWALLLEGGVEDWKVRHTAQACRAANLTAEQARFVDARTTPKVGRVSTARYERLVAAAIIEADLVAAEARRLAAATATYVVRTPADPHGLATLTIRGQAPDLVALDAQLSTLAAILKAQGDTRSRQERRATAAGYLAHPGRAAALLQWARDHGVDTRAEPDDRTPDMHAEPDGDTEVVSRLADARTSTTQDEDDDAWVVEEGEALAEAVSKPPPVLVVGDDVDATALAPKATVVVHVSADTLEGAGNGLVRVDGVGAATLEQVRCWLRGAHITLTPVVDCTDSTPIDSYEATPRIRRIVEGRWPVEAFPYGTRASKACDLDHPIPYVPMDQGGPPGQTGPDTLIPLARRHHRVATHGHGWIRRQPRPDTVHWRTPSGHWYEVTTSGGTRYLGTTEPKQSPLERQLADLIRTHAAA